MQLFVVFLTIIRLCIVMIHLKLKKKILLFQSPVMKTEPWLTQLFVDF